MTQALTGHGSFGSFLKRIKKTESDNCTHCMERDTPEHTLFECQRWEEERRRLEVELGGTALNADNMVEMMMKSDSNWRKVAEWMRKIISKKEAETPYVRRRAATEIDE